MNLGLPDKNEDDKKLILDENRTATLLLGDNNKLTFLGLLEILVDQRYVLR
jgi:hypothetical protein